MKRGDWVILFRLADPDIIRGCNLKEGHSYKVVNVDKSHIQIKNRRGQRFWIKVAYLKPRQNRSTSFPEWI